MKSTSTIFLCFFIFASACSSFAQDKERKILIITGDLNRPYEIIDFVFHAKKIEVEILSFGGYAQAYIEAVNAGTNEIEKAIRKAGADALINTRFQVVLYPAAKAQNPGDVIITGTVVKYKSDSSK